jgi:hypothetical protein
VHPQVSESKAGTDTVFGVVKENAENNPLKAISIDSKIKPLGNWHSMSVTYYSYVKLNCIRITVFPLSEI